MMIEGIEPNGLVANGLYWKNKKYTVQCGNCSHSWAVRVSLNYDICSEKCPCCGVINQWTHSGWSKTYEAQLKANPS